MKAILKFDLPEDRLDFNAATKAGSMAMALWYIVYNLKKEAERKFDNGQEHDIYEVIDYIFDQIDVELKHNGLDIDELTE